MTNDAHHHIIGTAGHVDHGKTELIRALTGSDTDRLREEKERGISIDLGFAPFTLPDGSIAGVVDVPGHERFINNMLAGIGGIDLVLLVIDVQEGIMPQTREHLAILQLLQIEHGIIVLTKCDLVDEEWIDIVEEEVRDELAESFLTAAPCCRVSAVEGSGIDELKNTIFEQLQQIGSRDADGPLRLPIDRQFSIAGFGTIVTGTLLSGTVHAGDKVELLPPGLETRVREIQVHEKKVESAFAGQRVALNLTGIELAQIRRGAIIGTPGIFEQTRRIDIRLNLLSTAPRPLKFRDPVHLFLGTARAVGVVALLDRDELAPGETAIVQVHLDRPLVAHRQDRFIIRSYSPMTTIGGGMVIDPKPVKHKRFRDDVMQALAELESGEKSFLLQKISELVCPKVKQLEQVSGLGRERIIDHLESFAANGTVIQLGEQWLIGETIRLWEEKLLARTQEYHRENPLQTGIPLATLKGVLPPPFSPKGFDQLIKRLTEQQKLVKKEDVAALLDFRLQPSPEQRKAIEQIETAYRQAGAQAKNRTEMISSLKLDGTLANDCLGYLFSEGKLIRLNDESFFHRSVYEQALELLRGRFRDKEFSLAEFRDALDSSRKAVQALLEYFDIRKFTMRKGDVRVVWKLPE